MIFKPNLLHIIKIQKQDRVKRDSLSLSRNVRERAKKSGLGSEGSRNRVVSEIFFVRENNQFLSCSHQCWSRLSHDLLVCRKLCNIAVLGDNMDLSDDFVIKWNCQMIS